MLRRMLAITLLIAFGFPLVAPAFAATADPEASLPSCCRSHGAHHCAMMHTLLPARSGQPAFVPPPCPFYPAATTVPRLADATLASPPAVANTLPRTPATVAAAPRRTILTFLPSANLTRGPPATA